VFDVVLKQQVFGVVEAKDFDLYGNIESANMSIHLPIITYEVSFP
jgi:hypothetical protein